MSRAYQKYMGDVLDEIERVIEKRRNRSNSRQVANQLFSAAPMPATSSAAAVPIHRSTATHDFKINVRAEVHRINSEMEGVSFKAVPESKPKNLDDNVVNYGIDTIQNNLNSEVNKAEAVLPCVKFTVGCDSDSEVDAEEASPGNFSDEIIQMEIEEVQREDQAKRKNEFVVNGCLIFGAIVAIGIFAACFYKILMPY